MTALTRIWEERTARERAVIALAGTLLTLAVAYAYVWLPVTRERDRLLVTVPQLRNAARQIESDAAEYERMKSIDRTAFRDLKLSIDQSAVASGISLRAGEALQQRTSEARLVIASVPAPQALAFLARLQSAEGVKVERLRMTQSVDGDRIRLEALVMSAR